MATSRTRKTAAPKPAEDTTPAEAPVEAPAEAPAPDAAPPADEPIVEILGPDDEAIATVEDDAAASDAPRQAPASAQLDAPAAPAAAASVTPSHNVIQDNSGQLSVDMVTQGPAEVRSELYDYATGEAPDPADVFALEFAHGTAVICKVRLCERLWAPGQAEPMSRLVMAAGQRTDAAYANQIVSILKKQLGIVDEPAEEV